jgi:UDP-GlcNAc:undecaprenyl-phosphate GlcNAc-1-phosphate transferase
MGNLAAITVPPLIAGLIAALLTTVLVPFVKRVAMSVRAVDYPGGRREHAAAVPRLGGLAILGGLFFGVGSVALVYWPEHGVEVSRVVLVAWLLGTFMVFVTGLIEDLVGMSAWKRFAVEIIAAWIVVSTGWGFDVFSLPIVGELHLGWAGPVITVVWIVGVTNAINFVDGLDGLAAGVIGIIAGSMAVIAGYRDSFFSAVVLAGIVGACVGFLRHNRAPATIFMGDAGSLTLGFVLGSLTVHSATKSTAAVAILVPILALGVPVIDTLLVMIVRFLEKPRGGFFGRFTSMFIADRKHLHHVLLNLRPRRQAVVRWIYGLVLLSCVGALAVALTKSGSLGLLLVGVEVVAILAVRQIGLGREAKALSEERRGELREQVLAAGRNGRGVS